MQTLDDLLYFEAVVRHGGFGAASRATGIAKSKLSRRVAALEDRLGVRLLERVARRTVVTRVGEAFYGHCRAAVAEAEAAEEVALRLSTEPAGLVRIACPPGFGEHAMAGIMSAFFTRYPKVRVEFLVSMRLIDIVEERVDLAVRSSTVVGTHQDLVMRKLGTIRIGLVASPAFVAGQGPLQTLDDLDGLPTLSISKDEEENLWTLEDKEGGEHRLRHQPRIVSNDFAVLRESAVEGLGVALLPEAICLDAIDRGLLVRVLPNLNAGQSTLHIVFTTRRGMRPAVEAFVNFMIAELPGLFGRHRIAFDERAATLGKMDAVSQA